MGYTSEEKRHEKPVGRKHTTLTPRASVKNDRTVFSAHTSIVTSLLPPPLRPTRREIASGGGKTITVTRYTRRHTDTHAAGPSSKRSCVIFASSATRAPCARDMAVERIDGDRRRRAGPTAAAPGPQSAGRRRPGRAEPLPRWSGPRYQGRGGWSRATQPSNAGTKRQL